MANERRVAWRPGTRMLRAACAGMLGLALAGATWAAARGPEGVEWRLLALGGTAVPAIPGGRPPSLRLDPAKKQAAGFAGCNNFFGGYEIAGAMLKFGPLGATRRACPDKETALETRVFEALARVRGWRLEGGELVLTDDGTVLARFTAGQDAASASELDSLTVRSKVMEDGPMTLVRGRYSAPAAPGSASRVTVFLTEWKSFGRIAGREAGAVVLVTSLGGSGSFYELALLERQEGKWANTDTVLLGDRVKVHSVALDANGIVVAMTAHGSKDPQCCPSQEVHKRFAVKGDRLVPAAANAKTDEPPLFGTTWQWTHTRYNNDTKAVPPKPENYTVRFQEGGKLNVKADCNLKGGTYALDGKKLSIAILNSTMAACEPGSLEDEFVRNLTAGVILFFRDGDLYIDLKYDSGTMKFSPRG